MSSSDKLFQLHCPILAVSFPFLNKDRLGCVVVERSPRVREIAGLIPDRVKSKTLTNVEMDALLGAQGCGIIITTDWLVSG